MKDLIFSFDYPIEGAVKATGVDSAAAKSNGKLCALRSCITSIPRFARLSTSAHVGTTLPLESKIDLSLIHI